MSPVRRTAESRRPSDANIVWASSVSVMAVSRVRPLPSRRIDHILCGTEDNRPDVGLRSARNHPGGLADEQSDHDKSDPARARPLVGGLRSGDRTADRSDDCRPSPQCAEPLDQDPWRGARDRATSIGRPVGRQPSRPRFGAETQRLWYRIAVGAWARERGPGAALERVCLAESPAGRWSRPDVLCRARSPSSRPDRHDRAAARTTTAATRDERSMVVEAGTDSKSTVEGTRR